MTDRDSPVGRAPGDWVANLRFDPTAWIAPGAVVTGDVRLGARSSLWFHTVLRGDTAPITVGDDSNVQDLSVVHVDEGFPAVIGARVTVGHRAIVHGCTIADDCLIGMGAIVLTGARIGAGSLIAAGALVREGQEIPPGSLAVGAPARVVGPVADAHREAIVRGAHHYVELSRSYMRRGFARPHPARRSDAGTSGREASAAPMTEFEWAQLVRALEAGPAEVAATIHGVTPERMRRRPGPERWSALEVLCHVRDSDRDVLVPRLARMLADTGSEPGLWIENIDMTGWERERHYAAETPEPVLAAWGDARAAAVARLATLGPAEWSRFAMHSVRGPYPLQAMVRGWLEHDLSHRRQIARALGAGG